VKNVSLLCYSTGIEYFHDQQDPWSNGPMVGYGADTKHYAGIPIDSYGVQPKMGKGTIGRSDYGVPMIGAFDPVNTYVYEPAWAPNAI
jgi:hypothetical protein